MSTQQSTGPKTEILHVAPDQLIGADWNYKLPGTAERKAKLSHSIARDGSAGVLAVREVPPEEGGPKFTPDGRTIYETMDGNHRLQEILALGWQSIPVENFGEISKAEAVLIARRRNENWFDDDIVAYGKLLAEEVLPQEEITIPDLAAFMPESEDELTAIMDLVKAHEWNEKLPDKTQHEGDNAQFRSVSGVLSEDAWKIWEQAVAKARTKLSEDGYHLHEDKKIAVGHIIDFLAIEFINSP
jgi:hypothetical protein